MSIPVANGASDLKGTNGVVKSDSSSDESGSSTVKNSSDSDKSDTSCKDTDFKKSSPEASNLSNVEETDVEDFSSSSPGKKADAQVQANPSPISQPSTSADSYLSDHNNFADNEDSCSGNVMKFQTMLENFRSIRKPREVNIGRVINRRRRRRRPLSEYMEGRNSPLERFEQRRRQQRVIAVGEPYPTVRIHYSESSQASAGSDTATDTATDTAGFSSDWFSAPESKKIETVECQRTESSAPGESAPGESALSLDSSSAKPPGESAKPPGESAKPPGESALSLDSSSAKPPDVPQSQEPQPECSSSNEASQGARRKRPLTLPSTKRRLSAVLSPLPTTPGTPETTPLMRSNIILSAFLQGNPHANRVNSLVSLIDSIVDFSNHMERTSLVSIQEPSTNRESGLEAPTLLVRAGRHSRVLRGLEEDFRRNCNELERREGENEEEACNKFIKSVRYLRDGKRLETDDMSYYSHRGTIVPPSNNPVSIEEIRETLPRIWNSIVMNNQMMTQLAYTVLDWCLQTTPEGHPQHFYDAEAAIRELYREVAEVHGTVNNLLVRWRSRSMVRNELGDLTYVSTLSGHALSLFSILEAEVVNIRFNLGTRQFTDSERRQRTDSEDTVSADQDTPESKKGKKE